MANQAPDGKFLPGHAMPGPGRPKRAPQPPIDVAVRRAIRSRAADAVNLLMKDACDPERPAMERLKIVEALLGYDLKAPPGDEDDAPHVAPAPTTPAVDLAEVRARLLAPRTT